MSITQTIAVVIPPFTFQVEYSFDKGLPATHTNPEEPPVVELLSIKHGEDECLQDLYERWPQLIEQIETQCLNRELNLL